MSPLMLLCHCRTKYQAHFFSSSIKNLLIGRLELNWMRIKDMKRMQYKACFESSFQGRRSFQQLFLQFIRPSVFCWARSVYHEKEARDIVQDVFFKIWKNRKSININTSFRNFLITSVRNGCTDYLRRQDIENQYMGKKRLFSIHTSPEELYTLKELESAIAEVLAEMPNNVREAFEMSRFKSHKNISKSISAKYENFTKMQDYLPIVTLATNTVKVFLKIFLFNRVNRVCTSSKINETR